MTTIQEIEKAIELLPLADQLRLYRDLPHLIGRDSEDIEWQRLAVEESELGVDAVMMSS